MPGVTLAVALVSALTGQPVRGDAAMSGELTLAGTVEPVGGIREKVLGACRARLAAVILPSANAADVAKSFGDELPCGISVRYASTMSDPATLMPMTGDGPQIVIKGRREDWPAARGR